MTTGSGASAERAREVKAWETSSSSAVRVRRKSTVASVFPPATPGVPCRRRIIRTLSLLLLAQSLWADHATRRRNNDASWYTRYSAYHPYCSTPEQMSGRKIPALQEDSRVGETRLLHVTAVLRHGARTPWKAGLNCWEDYATNPETAVWDCNLTTYLAPPPPARLTEVGATSIGSSDEAMFLFEKRYDALTTPQYNISNFLQGTCQLGQLLLQGYEQEFSNGQFIRDAYVFDESHYDHDERMRLIDISSPGQNGRYAWDDVYYRADDEIRTMMSGQVVLRGVLGPEMDGYFQKMGYYPVIQLHTADYERDIVDPNHRICPRLDEIQEENQLSRSFQALNQSAEATELRQFQRDILKVPKPNQDMDAIDCLMTTMCTDRPLPDVVNDYAVPGNRSLEDENGYFQRLFEFDTELYVNNIKANDAEYSKLSMGPLWFEIMKNIYPIIGENDRSNDQNDVKLAVIAGHDTTIMPLLAALSPDLWPDKEWPPYASMVLLEIHEVHIDGKTSKQIFRSNYAFRLIYNGEVVTSQIEDCPDDLDLCDAEILVNRVKSFAVLDADCQRQHEEPHTYQSAVHHAQEILSTTKGIISFLVVVLGSAAIGGASVYIYLTRGVPRRSRRSRQHRPVGDSEDDGIFMTQNGNGAGYHDSNEVDDDDGML